MTTSTQLLCKQQGGPFETATVPVPEIAPDQILLRQKVIALNLLDCKQRDTSILVPRWPHVLGIEGAGIVEAVGSDVKDIQPGDEVLACEIGTAFGENWGGAFQTRVVVPRFAVAKKPENMTLEDGASLPICYATALAAIALDLKIPLPYATWLKQDGGRAPASVLILGGASATGAAAIQLLRIAYPALRVVATASTRHHAHLSKLGATALVDYHDTAGLVKNIKAAADGVAQGVDMIIDCVGAGFSQTDICDAFDSAGAKMYAEIRTSDEALPEQEGVTKFVTSGGAIISAEHGREAFSVLTRLVEDGKYKLPVPIKVVGHGLDEVPGVLDHLKTVSGEKLVVTL